MRLVALVCSESWCSWSHPPLHARLLEHVCYCENCNEFSGISSIPFLGTPEETCPSPSLSLWNWMFDRLTSPAWLYSCERLGGDVSLTWQPYIEIIYKDPSLSLSAGFVSMSRPRRCASLRDWRARGEKASVESWIIIWTVECTSPNSKYRSNNSRWPVQTPVRVGEKRLVICLRRKLPHHLRPSPFVSSSPLFAPLQVKEKKNFVRI